MKIQSLTRRSTSHCFRPLTAPLSSKIAVKNSTRGRNSVFLIVATNLNYDITRDYDFRIALDDGYGGKLIELISLNITRVDPCPHVTECHVNATCNRINGREHVCLCRLGYAGDGYQNCTNIDECLPKPLQVWRRLQ